MMVVVLVVRGLSGVRSELLFLGRRERERRDVLELVVLFH